jgi:magnesium transporter
VCCHRCPFKSKALIKFLLDWIAHGILDSVVDSFFPLLKEIEKEVIAIDDLVFLASDRAPPIQVQNRDEATHSAMSEKVDTTQHVQLPGGAAMQTDPVGSRFFSPRLTVLMLKRASYRIWESITAPSTGSRPAANHFTLRRVARTRKLVTVSMRLLAAKSEVIAQIRKRLLTPSQSGLGNGTIRDEDVEVSIYLGDVQGALILTLVICFAPCKH